LYRDMNFVSHGFLRSP